METVSLAEAKAQLSKLIDQVEAGGEFVITRHGRPVARLTAVEQPRKPLDLDAIEKARNELPPWSEPSAKLIRQLRDEGY
jgi:prevent-host-death family protein